MGRLVTPRKKAGYRNEPSSDLKSVMHGGRGQLRDIGMSVGEVRIQVPMGRPFVEMIELKHGDSSRFVNSITNGGKLRQGNIILLELDGHYGLGVVGSVHPDETNDSRLKVLVMQLGFDADEHKLIAVPPGTWHYYPKITNIPIFTAEEVWALEVVASRTSSVRS